MQVTTKNRNAKIKINKINKISNADVWEQHVVSQRKVEGHIGLKLSMKLENKKNEKRTLINMNLIEWT